jgi:hypothetical protein
MGPARTVSLTIVGLVEALGISSDPAVASLQSPTPTPDQRPINRLVGQFHSFRRAALDTEALGADIDARPRLGSYAGSMKVGAGRDE